MAEYDTILTTTDFSDHALEGVKRAARLAKHLKSTLILAYVVEDRLPALILAASSQPAHVIVENHRKHAQENLRAYAAQHLAGQRVETVVLQGVPHEAIVDLARTRQVDMIVVGTHGHGFVAHVLLGSTAERIVHGSPCPVLVVPPNRD